MKMMPKRIYTSLHVRESLSEDNYVLGPISSEADQRSTISLLREEIAALKTQTEKSVGLSYPGGMSDCGRVQSEKVPNENDAEMDVSIEAEQRSAISPLAKEVAPLKEQNEKSVGSSCPGGMSDCGRVQSEKVPNESDAKTDVSFRPAGNFVLEEHNYSKLCLPVVFKCSHSNCAYFTESRGRLLTHISDVHVKEKDEMCEICHKWFTHNALRCHYRNYTDPKRKFRGVHAKYSIEYHQQLLKKIHKK